MLTLAQLKNTHKVDFEEFNNTLLRYSKIVADFTTNSINERERYFYYKNNYFRSIMRDGEVVLIGWEGNKLTPLLNAIINK